MMAREYRLTLGAGDSVPLNLGANQFSSWTIVDTGSSYVWLSFDDGTTNIKANPGDGEDGAPFERVLLTSDVAQAVTIRFSSGQQRTGDTINVNATATVESGNTCKAVADVVAGASAKTLVVAANASRKEVVIKSLASNGKSVRIGDNATVAANAGIELDPGEAVIITSSAAVYCHNADAADSVTLSITEIERI